MSKRFMIAFEPEFEGDEKKIFASFGRTFRVKAPALLDETEDPNEVLCNLQMQGNDHEADIIEQLAIKAGYWWKCPVEIGCGCVNVPSENACSGCGKPR